MLEHNVKIRVVDWDDRVFVQTVNSVWRDTADGDVDLDSREAAARAQLLLRHAGYPSAEVTYTRSVDEALHHVAHWTVRRQAGADDPTSRRH